MKQFQFLHDIDENICKVGDEMSGIPTSLKRQATKVLQPVLQQNKEF